MFSSLFKRRRPNVEEELISTSIDIKQKIQDFLTLAVNMDAKSKYNGAGLMTPLYVGWLKSEAQAHSCREQLPMLYLWNEDRGAGTFSLSVNGPLVAGLLEPLLPREHPQFTQVRDELMKVLNDSALAAVHSTCEKTGLWPSEAFSGEV